MTLRRLPRSANVCPRNLVRYTILTSTASSLVALLDTIAGEDHISRGQVVRRALVREVEQHIRRALRTLASPTTPAEQEEMIDGFCKVLGLGDDWNYTPR